MMSEQNTEIIFGEPLELNNNEQRLEEPEASYPQQRRFRSIHLNSENADDSKTETTEAIVAISQIEAVSSSEIDAYTVHDEAIADRYANAKTTIESVNQRTTDMHAILYEQAHKDISDAVERFEERAAQINYLADSMIRAINEQREVALATEKSTQAGNIAESERMQEKADQLLETNQDAARKLFREIENGQIYQSKLEKRRDDTIELLNEYVARRDQLAKELAVIEVSKSEFKEKLFAKEARRDELLEEEDEIKARERDEREKLAEPAVNQLLVSFGTPLNENTPEAIKESVKSIKNSVQSLELSRIMGELKNCHEKQEHNAKSIAHLKDMLEECELRINAIGDELPQLAARLVQSKEFLDGELTNRAIEIDGHSADATYVARVFEAIILGDTTAVAESTIPNQLHYVWDGMVEYQRTIARSDVDSKESKWKPPVFTTSLFSALGTDPEGDPTLSDQRAALEVRDGEAAELLDKAKVIGRGILRRGIMVHIHKASQQEAPSLQ